jgi:hypothetical protein
VAGFKMLSDPNPELMRGGILYFVIYYKLTGVISLEGNNLVVIFVFYLNLCSGDS